MAQSGNPYGDGASSEKIYALIAAKEFLKPGEQF